MLSYEYQAQSVSFDLLSEPTETFFLGLTAPLAGPHFGWEHGTRGRGLLCPHTTVPHLIGHFHLCYFNEGIKPTSTNYMFSITSPKGMEKGSTPSFTQLGSWVCHRITEFAAQKPYLYKTQGLCFARFSYSVSSHRQNLCLREKWVFILFQ